MREKKCCVDNFYLVSKLKAEKHGVHLCSALQSQYFIEAAFVSVTAAGLYTEKKKIFWTIF